MADKDKKEGEPDAAPDKSLNFTLIKNVVYFCIALNLYLAGFGSVYGLQSSINRKGNAGYYGLVARYIASVSVNFFLPSLSIKYLTLKWTFWLGIFLNIFYMAGQMFPSVTVLVITGGISGIGRGLYVAVIREYINIMAKVYILKNKSPNPQKVLQRFFILFSVLGLISDIMGSVSSLVALNYDTNPHYNETNIDYKHLCGMNYCPGRKIESPRLQRPNEKNIMLLAGFGLTVYGLALLFIIFFVPPETKYKAILEERKQISNWETSLRGIKLLRSPNQWIFLSFSFIGAIGSGFGQAYTESYISCGWGAANLGYLGLFGIFLSTIVGASFVYFLKYFKRVHLLSVASCVDIVLLTSLMFFYPNPHNYYVFFIYSIIMSIVGGLSMNAAALEAIFFPDKLPETSCNQLVFASLGFIFIYSTSPQFCNTVRIPILIALRVLAFGLYLLLEWRKPEKKYMETRPD